MPSAISYLTGPLSKLFDFKGSCGRKEFWFYWLWLLAIQILLLISLALSSGSKIGLLDPDLIALCILISQFFLISIRTRRLHDVGISGWWQLMRLIPSLGGPIVLILMALPGARKETTTNTQAPLPALAGNRKFRLKQWLFDFKGRTGRTDFWIYWLCLWGIEVLLLIFLFILIALGSLFLVFVLTGANDMNNDAYGWLAGWLYLLPFLW